MQGQLLRIVAFRRHLVASPVRLYRAYILPGPSNEAEKNPMEISHIFGIFFGIKFMG